MHKKILTIIVMLFTLINIYSKNILILHSYSPMYDWTNDVNQGLVDELVKSNHQVFVEYLYSRNNFTYEYQEKLVDVLSLRYEKKEIDAIITTDQNAFDLISEYKYKFLPDIPIFFMGAEFIKNEEMGTPNNIYGIFGAEFIEQNFELVKNIYPNKEIIVTVNKDDYGNEIVKKAQEYQEKSNTKIITISNDNFYETTKEISKYNSDIPVIIGNLYIAKENYLDQLKQISEEFSKTLKNPLFSLYNNQIGYGVIGGYVTDGFEEGKKLANQIIDYFNDKNIAKFLKEDYVYKFDKTKLEEFKIQRNLLPKRALIINKNNENIDPYVFWFVLILILFLLFMTLYSLYHMFKMRREKKYIEKESFRDTLTKVYNRKKLDSLKSLFNDKYINKEIVAYVVDLDNLKPINDTFGHDVGDNFIIYTAEILKESFDEESFIFRIGGDEFYIVALLDLENIKEEIESLNKKINRLIKIRQNNLDKPFNISYGYAIKRSYENIDQTFKRADEKMYLNKQKNKINY